MTRASRTSLLAALLSASVLVPALAIAAGSAAWPAYRVLQDDVGVWDAQIVRWDASRRPETSRGVAWRASSTHAGGKLSGR
jgi:hypothetical protein